MSFTETIALALLDWQSSSFRPPLRKRSMPPHRFLNLRGRSDIDRLPNELLSTIFMFAIEQHCHDEPTPFTTSPTTISHICHRWRQVALETGSLWTNIVLTFPTSNEQLTRTLTWLSRSKAYSLDILLDFRDPEWDWEDEDTHGFRWADMEVVLRLLLPTAARWRTVELLTDTWAPMFAFLLHTRSVGASMKRLETLHLARCNAYFARKGQLFEPTALGHHLPLFGGADAVTPKLREVMLTGVHIDWSTPPLANLTKLELKYQAVDVMPTIAHFTQILAASPNLEVLSIVGRGPQFIGEEKTKADERGRITLDRVTKFTFGFVDVSYAVQLLSMLDLPALCELSLEDVSASLQHQPPDDASVLLEWLAGLVDAADDSVSQPPSSDVVEFTSASTSRLPLGQLKTLILLSIFAPRATFSQLYETCPELRILRLCDSSDSALKALGTEDPSEALDADGAEGNLPHLKNLFVRGIHKELFTRAVSIRETSLEDSQFEESAINAYAEHDT
ncbi:hypothetical protein C8R45DRAFT_990271 [Mycena sanguinolenta]|nr:hypothetical protein C8R45DRAFT_990271 [Mycena sanguinolenta]